MRLMKTLNGIKSIVSAIWNAMPDIVRNPMNQVKDAVLSICNNIKKGINDRLGGVRDTISGAMNAVYQAVIIHGLGGVTSCRISSTD